VTGNQIEASACLGRLARDVENQSVRGRDAESVGCGVIADVSSETNGANNRATPPPLSQRVD
jgi:hypothetical protein